MRGFLILALTGCTLKDATFPAETGDTYAPAEWEDADGDGYVVSDDCDDNDPAIHPLADELCDGVDNDCDAEIDEGAQATWYTDADGDGYGDPSSGTESCAPEDGQVDNALDCDDADAAVSPSAEEVLKDGVDNDCDGAYEPWDGAVKAAEVSAVTVWGVGEGDGTYADSPDYAGKRLLSVGDLTGDGVADLVVSAPAANESGSVHDNGGAFVFAGPLSGELTLDDAAGVFYGNTGGLAGYGLTALGDLDGSGTRDVGMGNDGGRFWIMLSSSEPGAPLSEGNLLYETSGSSYFGLAASGGADYDGDGAPDLIVGASLAESHRGGAYLFTGDLLTVAVGDYTLWVEGDEREMQLGNAVALVDLDADGVGDALFGASAAPGGGTRSGAVYAVEGGQSGAFVSSDMLSATTDIESCGMGYALSAAGDVTGDGAVDALIGAPNCGVSPTTAVGAVWLVEGGADALSGTEIQIAALFTGQKAYDYLGVGLAPAGDLDGDGVDEVLLGGPGRTDGDVSGQAGLWYGPIDAYSNPLEDADAVFYGTAYYEQLGYAVGGGQDLTGDGLPDLVFGGPTAEGLGVVRVVSGTAL